MQCSSHLRTAHGGCTSWATMGDMSAVPRQHLTVHALTIAEELARLCRLFQSLHDAKVKLSPKKCFLLQKSVSFLGHVVRGDGVLTDPRKIKAVRDLPHPRTTKEVRSFPGLILQAVHLGICWYCKATP